MEPVRGEDARSMRASCDGQRRVLQWSAGQVEIELCEARWRFSARGNGQRQGAGPGNAG